MGEGPVSQTDPMWIGFLPFTVGNLEGFAEIVSDLPTTAYPDIKRCCEDMRKTLDKIESRIDLFSVPF